MITVDKAWGKEEWIVNNECYCYKHLFLNPGWKCSLHYHKVKDETFFVLEGSVYFQVGSNQIRRSAGDEPIRIKTGVSHMFWSDDYAVIGEVSTHHDDFDVVRIVESGKV